MQGREGPLSLKLQSLAAIVSIFSMNKKPSYALDLGQGGTGGVVRTLVCEGDPFVVTQLVWWERD